MILLKKNLFSFFFNFHHVLQFQKILRIVVQYLKKDIFGINMLKHLMKNGVHLFICNWLFVKKESDFNWLAKPPRKKLFKVIPFKRPSSSFGYSQAVKGTWEQYKERNKNPLATRARFKDSVDFIGWYINKTNKILKISKKDAYRQYLAYYKGWGDYKNYSKDKKAIIYAKSVKDMALNIENKLTLCKKNLDKNKYIIF